MFNWFKKKKTAWSDKAQVCADHGTRYYGGGGTISGSYKVDVETTKEGKVVAVWFRCQHLPFSQVTADEIRTAEMERLYKERVPGIEGIDLLGAGK